MSYKNDLHEKDGAWRADAKIAAGVDDLDNSHPLNCTEDGTLEIAITSNPGGPIDVIVDNVVPVSQSGTWIVNLATEPTIDIGKVDQGTPNTLANGWPVKITDGLNVLGTVANPVNVAGSFAPPALQNVNLTQINGTPFNLGQTLMASSLPVTFASDQSALPVTGTFFQTTQPVSGTLTVLQGTSPWVVSGSGTFLTDGSAHVQPVSGTFFQATQPVSLTSTTITGTVAVTQSTSPWVVSGTITTSPNVNVHDGSGNTISSTGTSLNVDVTNTVPVTGTFFQATQPVSLTSTTITGNVTVVQPTGTNLNVNVTDFPATQTVTGTVAVTQSTSPWVVSGTVTTTPPANASTNLTQVAGVNLGATAVTAYGTAPAATNVPGVNAFITNTPAVTLTSTTLTGTSTVAGNKTNNNAAPGATNLGVLPGVANAATQTWTEGDQVLESMDLSGRQRIRGTLTNNNAAPAADQLSVIPAVANAAAPTLVEGNQVLLSTNLSGQLRDTGGGVAQASTTSGEIGPLMQGAVTTNAPTYVTAQTDPLSLGVNGYLRSEVCTGVSEPNERNVADLSVVVTDTASPSQPLLVAPAMSGGRFSGTASASLQGFTASRNPTVFKTVSTASTGSTAVWTAGTGNKWRLLRYQIEVTDNSSLSAGAVLVVQFLDVAASIGIAHSLFVPTTAVVAGAVAGGWTSNWVDIGPFGIVAAATATALNINLSAALATGACRVNVCGTEE